MKIVEKYYLLSHPDPNEISRHMWADFEADEDLFDTYTCMPSETSILSDDPLNSLQEIRVSPDRLERGKSMASMILTGTTDDNRRVVIDFNPFLNPTAKGFLYYVEDETKQ
jgi:hypothetical protein